MPSSSFPTVLAEAFETAATYGTTLSDPQSLALVAFCAAPQFGVGPSVFQFEYIDEQADAYARLVGTIERRLDRCCQDDPRAYLSQLASDGQRHSWGPRTAACLLCARAARAAGYPLEWLDDELLDLLDGIDELLALATDPAILPLVYDLAPSWQGSAAAMACALRLGIGAPVMPCAG